MKHFLCVGSLSLGLLLGFPTISLAAEISVSALQAQGKQGKLPTILLTPGNGVNLSFLDTGERVHKAWLDDPSRIAIGFDSPLESGASVIHLKEIQKLNLEGITRSADGTTTLSVITSGRGGRKLYTFKLGFASGAPKYSTVRIVSGSGASENNAVFSSGMQSGVQSVESGLRVAIAQGSVKPNGSLHRAVERFTSLVRQGTPVANAAQMSGLSPETIYRLAKLGNGSPKIEATPASQPKTPLPIPDRDKVQVSAPQPSVAAAKPSTSPKPSAETAKPPASNRSQPSKPKREAVKPKPTVIAGRVDSDVAPAIASDSKPKDLKIALAPETSRSSTRVALSVPLGVQQADALLRGLGVARNKKQIGYQTAMWRKVQDAVYMLRLGKSKEQAASRSGVPLAVIDQLLKWGGMTEAP